MAARRALRRLGGRSPLFGDPGAPHFSWWRSIESGRWSSHAFNPGKDDRDEEKKQRQEQSRIHPLGALGFGNSRGLASVAGFSGTGFSHRSVRFCSSAGAAALNDAGALNDAATLTDAATLSSSGSAPEALRDAALEVVASISPADEIAAAAADSFPWTAAVQYVIYDVHALTGLPWWLSIALTTLTVRAMVVPLVIYQVKSTARFSLLRPELEKIKADLKASDYNPEAVAEHRKKMSALFTKHKTDPFTPVIGALLQGPIFMCFFFGLRTMAEKMESFKTGGDFWFTDLTTPDDLYLLPLITTLTFLITVELGSAEGMQGQPNQKRIKNFLRGMGLLFLPLTASFPKALFCYWVTSNLWSLLQGAALRNRSVKAFLEIPETSHLGVPPPPPIISSKPPKKNQVFEKKRSLAQ